MLVIRLTRTGKKGQPNYRIVVTDQRKSVYSPYVENLGHYDPRTKKIVLDKEKTLAWMNKGAKPSNTVAKILEKEGLKHKSIVIKKFRAVSKKELEAQKVAEEAEKTKVQAEKEAAKEAFEAKVEEEKKEHAAEDKLQAAAAEAIEEIKEEEVEKAQETEKETVEEDLSTEAPASPAGRSAKAEKTEEKAE